LGAAILFLPASGDSARSFIEPLAVLSELNDFRRTEEFVAVWSRPAQWTQQTSLYQHRNFVSAESENISSLL
jgi:hypothetical protein